MHINKNQKPFFSPSNENLDSWWSALLYALINIIWRSLYFKNILHTLYFNLIYGLLKQNRNNSFLQLGGGKGVVGSHMEIFCFKADNLTGRFFSDKGILLHVIYLKKPTVYEVDIPYWWQKLCARFDCAPTYKLGCIWHFTLNLLLNKNLSKKIHLNLICIHTSAMSLFVENACKGNG